MGSGIVPDRLQGRFAGKKEKGGPDFVERMIFGRVFHFLSEERQWEKLSLILHQYLLDNPVAIVGAGMLILALVLSLLARRRASGGRINWLSLALCYGGILLILVFSRYWQGDVRGIRIFSWGYFLTDGGYHEGNVLITLANALIFVLFGLLLQKAAERVRLSKKLLLLAGAGFLVEALQFIFARGNSSILDLLVYILGGFAGMGFMSLLQAGRSEEAKRR